MGDKKLQRAVKAAMKGDESAFNEVIRLRGRNILYIALSLMENRQDGEDAAQDAVVAIKRNIGNLKNPELFDVWMYRIVFNACMKAKRAIRKTSTYLEPDVMEDIVPENRVGLLPEQRMMSSETLRELSEAIKELPERHRLCLLLFYYDGMSYEQIADVLGIQVHDVSNTLVRAKRKLRATIGDPDALVQTPGASESGRTDAERSAAGVAGTGAAARRQRGSKPGMSEDGVQGGSMAGMAGVGVPAMTLAFEQEERLLVTQAMVDRLTAEAARPLGATVTAAAAGATASSAAAFFGTSSGKAVFGAGALFAALCLAGVIALGSGAVGGGSFGLDPTEPSAPTSAPKKSAPAAHGGETPLEEVLTPGRASEFETFVQDTHPVAQWEEFSAAIEMRYLFYRLSEEYQYTVYVYDNPETGARLVAIAREDRSGTVEIAYNTGASGMEVPTRAQTAATFDAWRT